METVLASLSKELKSLVESSSPSLLHIYTEEAAPRTGLVLSRGEALTVAAQAEIGETVEALTAAGRPGSAAVTGFDETSGLVLLELQEDLEVAAATFAAATPAVGALAVSVAYPSRQSVEARLEMIRCVGSPIRLPAGRRLESYLQTDALSYPGFSGAPLLSPEGEAVAVALPSRSRGENLYITAGEAVQIRDSLRRHTRIVVAYLGVRGKAAPLEEQAPENGGRTKGLLLIDVEGNSPAQKAGLQVGDMLLTIDGRPVDSLDSLLAALIGPAKRSATVTFLRGGSPREATVELVERSRGERRRR